MTKSKGQRRTVSKESVPADGDASSTEQNTNANNGPDIDPLESMDTSIEPSESHSMCGKNNEPTNDEQNPSNADDSAKTILDFEPKIRLVPITSLLNGNVPKTPPIDSSIVDFESDSDSDSEDDQPLKQLAKAASNKISSKTKDRRESNESNVVNNNTAKKPMSKKSNANNFNGHKPNKLDIVVPAQFNVMVNLDPLPKRMESALKKFNLSEIRDYESRGIASSKPTVLKSHRDSETKNAEAGGSGSDSEYSVISSKKNEPLRRRTKRKQSRLIDSSDDNDTDPPAEKKQFRMRKKNIPKSSNDVTDPERSSSSDDEIEENNRKKDSDDDFDPMPGKRRRIIRSKRNDSDDDDSSYSGNASKSKRRKRIRKVSDSSDDDDDDDDDTPKKHGRKNIRKVTRYQDLEDETKEAAQRERERKKRIEERQKMYNQMYEKKPEKIEEMDELVLDFDLETKESLLSVDKKLVKKLKPHQAQGVKFMWDACFESIEKINEIGGGCILAHCMGLGKTLQVVTLVHTLLSNSDVTNVEKVLVICPVSTVLNWVNEFKIWLKHCAHNKNIDIYEISKYKQTVERAYQIKEWHTDGGVLILGYDMFRNLSSETNRARKKQKEAFQRGLIDPGADLVVCDEGHLLKNSKTSLSKAVNRIRTLRRIVLTGTPLQNNLNEYYCMVQFVKPNLLGKYNEYLNRFVNPITNGQYTDSTPYDIQMMKRRSHILHKMLDGCVQRRDYAVLAPFLPPKHEFVLYIRLTKLQIDLYKYYMEHKPVQAPGKTRSAVLFQDFQNLQRIWTHPRVLRYNSDRYEQMIQKKKYMASDDEEGSLGDFIDDDDDASDSNTNSSGSSSESGASSVQSIHSDEPSNSKKTPASRRTRATAPDSDPEPIESAIEPVKEDNPTEWWMQLVPEEELNNMEYSGKLVLLFSILAECEACGDKLLVFSQSLFSLDVIENFLGMMDENTQNPSETAKLGGFTGSWSRGLDYFRLDGSTNIETRNMNCNVFNSEENLRARLFLISTRAGGLGINLVAANRVIIFDASWNPSHDIQSIFRVYRFGQKKPCYIYRFIAMGTMEEKIYERQVTKLAISKRVIDEHQIDRHYKEHDLMELYNIENIDRPDSEREQPPLPKDRLLAEQLSKYPNFIFKYHEHDSLLENKSDETLSAEEINAAWKEFEEEKNRPTIQAAPSLGYPAIQRAAGTGPVTSNNIFGIRTDILLQLLNIKARRMYPGSDNLSTIVPTLLTHLYDTMAKNDTSFFQELMYIHQTEMAAPSPGSYLTPAGHVMPPYSGRGRPPLNPQNSAMHMHHQQLMQQNRLMMNNGNAPLPTPTQVSQIIEID